MNRSFPYIFVTSPVSYKESLLFILWNHDVLGLEEIDENRQLSLIAYFSCESERVKCSEKIRKSFPEDIVKVERGEVNEKEWAESLYGGFEVLKIAGLTIKPYHPGNWSGQENNTIYIYPGRGYGTGSHSTTRKCLEYIEELELEGKEFLDFGCGSGVLSIAALIKGAIRGVAIDNDADAVENAAYNFKINSIQTRVKLFTGSVSAIGKNFPEKSFPVVLANLNSTIIPEIMEEGLSDLIQPEGLLVLSGIHIETLDTISALFPQYSLIEQSWKRHRQWTTVLLQKVSH